MLKIKFKDIEALGDAVIKTYKDEARRNDYPEVGVCGNYDVICKLANYVLHNYYDINLNYAEIADEFTDGYCHEFMLEIDHERNMWIEKAYVKDTDVYLGSDGDYFFIHSDCDSRLAKALDGNTCVEFCVTELDGEEDADYGNEKEEIKECCCDENQMYTISKTEEKDGVYSYVSITCSDKSLVEEFAEKWKRE